MQLHKTEPIFVGRRDELKRFGEILASPKGQAVLVVGPQGMGKTLLVDKMARMAQEHPDLKCGTVRYEVTQTENVATTMARMIDHAFEAANVGKKFLSGTGDQWRALFKAVGVVPVVGKAAEAIGELALSLKRDPAKDTRTQFIERLRLVSEKMPDDVRAIFVIDPEKYMMDDSHDEWRLVLRDLPDRIIFLFAQRPDDVLAKSADFNALTNVQRIPEGPLDVLDEHEVDDLVQAWAADLPSRARKEAGPTPEAEAPPEKHSLTVASRFTATPSGRTLGSPITDVRAALARYEGHPYAVAAALGLLADGAAIADLPVDPTPTGVAKEQWRQLRDEHKENAIKLFEAYAILEVPVPDEVVETVSGVVANVRKSLVANAFVAGLLRPEPDGTRIYHSLLADAIQGQISESDARAYHTSAIEMYCGRLNADAKPDALAAVRLPEHVLAVEGPKQFLTSLANECFEPLVNLGLLDAVVAMCHRAMENYVARGSRDNAILAGNLASIHTMRGEFNEAQRMHCEALEINRTLGHLAGMAIQYGNLGLIYRRRGDLDEAEKMHRMALGLEIRLRRHKGMAGQYNNLGSICLARGHLDDAQQMFLKALGIQEKLRDLIGMAISYGNLGVVFQGRGDLDEAEKMHREALRIEERLGRLEGMANQYGNLGVIYGRRDDLGEAEKMIRNALEIDQKLGRLEGMGNHYCNLGRILQTRGDLDDAGKLWTKARELYAEIGMPHEVERVQGFLDGLPDAGEDRSQCPLANVG